MEEDIHYLEGIGFVNDKTKAAFNVTPQQLSSYAKLIAAGNLRFGDKLTICVSVVQENGYQALVYTANHQKTTPGIEAAAKKLGIPRWDVDPGIKGRGNVGAPNDAEQIVQVAAEQNGAEVLAVAPSRKACLDCATLIINKGIKYISPNTGNIEGPLPQIKSTTKSSPKFKPENKATFQKEPLKELAKQTPPKLNERGTGYNKSPKPVRQNVAITRLNTGIRYGAGVATVLGIAYPYIAQGAIEARRDKEGYIPYGPAGYSDDNMLSKIARGTLDPSLGNEIPLESRFNVKVWRSKLYELVRSKKTNDTITVTWQLIRKDIKIASTIYEDVEVRYLKLQTGKWIPLLSDPINLPTIPELNYVLNPEVSDQSILNYLQTIGSIKA